MTTAWAHLPNAKRIDRILEDVGLRPEVWDDAHATWDKVRFAAWDEAMDNVFNTARNGVLLEVWAETKNIAQDAVTALFAWDDCAYILDLHPNVVRLMAAAGNQPAILMEAAVIVMHEELE